MTRSSSLLVLGAGPAGLAAAWRAARHGHDVVVLEAGPQVGGMAASFDVAGVRVDHGSHRLHPATPPHLLDDLRQLLGGDLQTRRRNGRLRVGDSWVAFPLQAADLVRVLPRGLLGRLVRDAVTSPLRRGDERSYASVVRSGLGPTLYDAVYGPYAEKLWGLAGERIAADQARRRVSADTPWKVARRMLSWNRSQRPGQGRTFHYPRRGFGQLVEALAQAAADAGAEIRVQARAETLTARSDGVVVRTAGGGLFEAAHVFSTVPLPVLGRICDPAPPPEALAAAGSLRFRAMVLVYVVHGGGRWTEYDAHYVPDRHTPVTRISEPMNYRDSHDDPGDRTVLCMEIPCAVGESIWSASDTQVADLVADALAVAELPGINREHVEVRRLPHVYPVYELGYADHLAALDRWSASLVNVTSFGRLGLFAHDNTHHALAMAYDAVAALGSGRFDGAAWAAARARFATHVVED